MKRRNVALDFLRSVAAIAVVVYHVLGSSASNDPAVQAHIHLAVTAVTNTLQWHVPVFFMITGYLWLSDDKPCTFQKMIPNIRRFLCVLFTIGFAYAIMERFFMLRSISVSSFINSIADVLNGNLWDHMWYIYTIIGVYLLLPVLKKIYANSTEKELGFFVLLLFAFGILTPFLYEITGYEFPIELPASSSLFYVCAGGLIAKKGRLLPNAVITFCVFFLCSMVILLMSFFMKTAELWLPLMKSISAVSLFLAVLLAMSQRAEWKWLRTFSDCTFGIYLFHPFFINVMIKLLHLYPLRSFPMASLSAACLTVILLSFITTYILRTVPVVKKYIL